MIALIILGVIAAVITCIMLLSVTVYVKIGEEVDIKVGAAGIKFPIVPLPEKEEKPEKAKTKKVKKVKKPKEEKKAPPDKKTNSRSLSDTIEFAIELLRSVVPGAVGLIRKIRFTNMRIFISVANEDADQTAIQYGYVCTAVYDLLACIDKAMTLKVKDVSIVPDFVTGAIRYDVSFKVKLRIGGAVSSALGILFKLIGTFIRQANKKPKAAPPHPAPNKKGGKPKEERIESV